VDKIGDNSIRFILEELFRETLVSGLSDHLASENDMKSRFKRKKREIENKYEQILLKLQKENLSTENYQLQREEHMNLFRQQIQLLEDDQRQVQILFIQAYKEHLKTHVSNFSAIGTLVKVTLLKNNQLYMGKDNQYLTKQLRLEDKLEELLPCIEELVQLQQDKVNKYGDIILFTCISPLENQSSQSVLQKLTADDPLIDDHLTVSKNCRAILEHKILPGTLIIVHGDILLESEVPKQCIIETFLNYPNREHIVDYFECTQCLRNGQSLRC
ncbi:unnamed protein product, partial [Didymodactylos carnosus]